MDAVDIEDSGERPFYARHRDWIEMTLSEAQRYEGVAYIETIVRAILVHAASDESGNDAPIEEVSVARQMRETLVPAWSLCWQIYHREIPLSSYFRQDGLTAAFTCAGEGVLPVLVAAQLWFDYATFARNYDLLGEGLQALDTALPTGTSKEDFPLFRAVEVLSSVHASCSAARSETLRGESAETEAQAAALPSSAIVRAIEQAAIDEDVDITQNRQPTTVKTLSYLMRTVELLPMPDSVEGRRLVRVKDFYRLILDQAVRSLHRDGRSNNGNSDVYFRCARVHHALGDIDLALDDLRNAISLVDDSNVYVAEQYYTFLRDLQQEQSVRRRLETQIKAFDEVLEDKLAESRTQIQAFAHKAANDTRGEISGALFRVVEILGVFLALIGLLATTIGTAVFSEGDLDTRIIVLIGGYLGALSFFVILRAIVKVHN